MEFRCKLGTPGGQIVEAVYAAESEAHLRRDLEEKGLLVLSLRPSGLLGGLAPSFGRRRRFASATSSSSTRSWRRCSRPACRWCNRSTCCAAVWPIRCSSPSVDTVYDRVKAGAQISDAFDEFGALVPRVYVASLMAGERSGNLEVVLRRYVAYARMVASVRRKTISALMYPLILLALAVVVVAIIVFRLVPAFSDFYASFGSELPTLTLAILSVSNFARTYWLALLVGGVGLGWAPTTWFGRPGQRVRIDRAMLVVAVGGRHRAQVRDLADGAHAGDAARRRHPARAGAGRGGAVGEQPLHRARARDGRPVGA